MPVTLYWHYPRANHPSGNPGNPPYTLTFATPNPPFNYDAQKKALRKVRQFALNSMEPVQLHVKYNTNNNKKRIERRPGSLLDQIRLSNNITENQGNRLIESIKGKMNRLNIYGRPYNGVYVNADTKKRPRSSSASPSRAQQRR